MNRALLLCSFVSLGHAALSSQNVSTPPWPAGVTSVTFGPAQRYNDATGKEMCAIVKPVVDPPVFERGTREITYAIGLQPRTVTRASARVVAPAGQELRTTPCNIFTLVARGFSQTQLGSTIARADNMPLVSGRYVLRITIDGHTTEVAFTIK